MRRGRNSSIETRRPSAPRAPGALLEHNVDLLCIPAESCACPHVRRIVHSNLHGTRDADRACLAGRDQRQPAPGGQIGDESLARSQEPFQVLQPVCGRRAVRVLHLNGAVRSPSILLAEGPQSRDGSGSCHARLRVAGERCLLRVIIGENGECPSDGVYVAARAAIGSSPFTGIPLQQP